MKFRVPSVSPRPDSPGTGGFRSRGRPEWLKEWLENRGKWLVLDCGCEEAWDEKSMTVLYLFGPEEIQIFCETCQRFAKWKEWISWTQYLNISPAATSDEPLF
jgi:hypothetical protein